MGEEVIFSVGEGFAAGVAMYSLVWGAIAIARVLRSSL